MARVNFSLNRDLICNESIRSVKNYESDISIEVKKISNLYCGMTGDLFVLMRNKDIRLRKVVIKAQLMR